MTENELRELIRLTIEEILAPKRALVLFTGALLGFETAVEQLRRLRDAGVELDYLQTPSAKRILDQDVIAGLGMQEVSNKLVAAHQVLVVPTLTVNIAAKVSHGIGDCLASNLMAEFIMADRPVVAVRNAACPDSADKLSWFPKMPAGYAARLRANLTELAGFGVRLCDADAMSDAVLSCWGVCPAPVTTSPSAITCRQRLISDTDIRGLPAKSTLRVLPTATLTPLAADSAARLGIQIVRVEEV